MHACRSTLEDPTVAVTVDPASGTFSLRRADGLEVAGLGRLVDGGDGGDTYNHSPPDADELVEAPVAVEVSMLSPSPVRARLLVRRTYEVPQAAVGDERRCSRRSDTRVPMVVDTVLELRAGEELVRVRTELDHHVRDHRLRLHFPLPAPVRGSDAGCAFAVVHRGLAAEGGPHEAALATFPARRFVDCADPDRDAGLAILHDGLMEHEVVGHDDAGRGHELAVTLLRATGYLSRVMPALRPNPAGPPLAVAGAQLAGRRVLEHAVLLHRGDWREARCHAAADAFLLPLLHAPVPSGAAHRQAPSSRVGRTPTPPVGQALAVEGAEVAAVLRDGDAVVVRLFNPAPVAVVATVRLHDRPARGRVVDLVGREVDRFESAMELGPGRIVTLCLDPAPTPG